MLSINVCVDPTSGSTEESGELEGQVGHVEQSSFWGLKKDGEQLSKGMADKDSRPLSIKVGAFTSSERDILHAYSTATLYNDQICFTKQRKSKRVRREHLLPGHIGKRRRKGWIGRPSRARGAIFTVSQGGSRAVR